MTEVVDFIELNNGRVCIQLSDDHVDMDRHLFERLAGKILGLPEPQPEEPPQYSVVTYRHTEGGQLHVFQRVDDDDMGWISPEEGHIYRSWEYVLEDSQGKYTVIYDPSSGGMSRDSQTDLS